MTKPFSYSLDANASKCHKQVVKFFKDKLPGFNISQNHKIKIDDKTLFIDIFCNYPFKFSIEIQGQQHTKFNKFHYKTMADFKKAQANDRSKKLWCEMNGYCYIEVQVQGFKIETFYDYLMERLKEFSEKEE